MVMRTVLAAEVVYHFSVRAECDLRDGIRPNNFSLYWSLCRSGLPSSGDGSTLIGFGS
jgi:hypothetical protein